MVLPLGNDNMLISIVLVFLLINIVFGCVYPIDTRSPNPTLNFVEKEYVTNYTDPIVFHVSLKDNNVPVSGISINVYVISGGSASFLGSKPTNSSGIATISVLSLILDPGNYQVLAQCTYNGVDLNATSNLIVNREVTKISVPNNISVQYTDNVSISVSITTDDGEPIPNVDLVLYLTVSSGFVAEIHSTSNSDGVAIFVIQTTKASYGSLNLGMHDIVVSFDGNRYYLPASSKSTINVLKEKIVVEVSTIGKAVVGASLVILVKVFDDDNTPVSFAEVRIFIDGEIVGAGRTNNDGIYEFSWSPSEPGNHTISIIVMKSNYENATYSFVVIVEGNSGDGGVPTLFIAILVFLILAVVIAYFSRR